MSSLMPDSRPNAMSDPSQHITGSFSGLTIPLDVFPDLFALARQHSSGNADPSWDYAIGIAFSAISVEAGIAVGDAATRTSR